jgi:hypothetical protein
MRSGYQLRIFGQLYTEKELYVLFWRLFYKNDAMERAKTIIDEEIKLLNVDFPPN